MQPFFSTTRIHPRNAFRRWRETICERLIPSTFMPLHDVPFHAGWTSPASGACRSQDGPHSHATEATPDAIRRHGSLPPLRVHEALWPRRHPARRSGGCIPDGRLRRLDAREQSASSRYIPCRRSAARALRGMLGPSRQFCALDGRGGPRLHVLASTFIHELIRVGHQLTPDAAARMASIGVDLIVASLAERMAQEVPAVRPRHRHGPARQGLCRGPPRRPDPRPAAARRRDGRVAAPAAGAVPRARPAHLRLDLAAPAGGGRQAAGRPGLRPPVDRHRWPSAAASPARPISPAASRSATA